MCHFNLVVEELLHLDCKSIPDYVLKRYCRLSEHVKDFSRDLLDDDMIEKMQYDSLFIRLIADHIGGMTDQYASRTYKKLYYPDYI